MPGFVVSIHVLSVWRYCHLYLIFVFNQKMTNCLKYIRSSNNFGQCEIFITLLSTFFVVYVYLHKINRITPGHRNSLKYVRFIIVTAILVIVSTVYSKLKFLYWESIVSKLWTASQHQSYFLTTIKKSILSSRLPKIFLHIFLGHM